MESQLPMSRFPELNHRINSPSSSQNQSSQSLGISRQHKGKNAEITEKASWDAKTTEIFIRICVEELRAGNRPGSHFSKLGWENIICKFAQLSNHNYTRVQLKNRWDNLKKEWGVWKTMLRGESGLGWNNEKGTIDATPEWWQRKIQACPDAVKFRERGPILLDEQELLFSDVVATGESAWAPSSGLMPPHMEQEVEIPLDSQIGELNNLNNEFNVEPDTTTNNDVEIGVTESGRKRSRETHQPIRNKKYKKITTADKVAKCLERLVDAMENESTSLHSNGNIGRQYSIHECLEILEKMSGIEKGDQLWMYATRLILKPAIRELFLTIKKDEIRLKWLQEQMERDMQRRASSMTSAYASRGISQQNDNASSG